MSTSYEDILFEIKNRVATITLNRPDRLNAWTSAMDSSIKRAVIHATQDDDVRVIVVTGSGRGFCAGADMEQLKEIEDSQGGSHPPSYGVSRRDRLSFEGPDVTEHYKGRFGYIQQCPKPIIAALNGPAAGVGLVMALYCDMRFAASNAFITTAFSRRGLIAEHGTSWLLPHLVGLAQSLDLLFSARKVGAEEAYDMGLVNKVFAQESFMDEVMGYARMLADMASPRSIAVIKSQVYAALFQSLNEAIAIGDEEMGKSFTSEDFREGIAHFVEKRAASFTGR
ncbi:MAG: enoyl-CoA hydratase [Parvularculales bacterium]